MTLRQDLLEPCLEPPSQRAVSLCGRVEGAGSNGLPVQRDVEARRGGEFYRLNQLSQFFPGGYTPADDTIIQQMIDNVKATLPAVMGDAVLRQNRATCWGFSEVMRATNPNLGG